MNRGIPIREFVELIDSAAKAFERKDKPRIAEINARLAEIGYRVMERNGTPYVENIKAAAKDIGYVVVEQLPDDGDDDSGGIAR